MHLLQHTVVTSLEGLAAYKNKWSEILVNEDNDNPFIEYEWLSTWWQMLGIAEPVEIFIVKHKDEAVAFFPFLHTVKLGVHRFSFVGQGGLATYMGVISDKVWMEKAIDYVMDHLADKYKHVIFDFHGLLESKDTSYLIEKYAIKKRFPYSIFRVVTPYIDFTTIDFQRYLKNLRSKFRGLQRRENRLKSLGHVSFKEVEDSSLDEMFHLFRRRWKKKMDTSEFTELQTREFFVLLVKQSSDAFHIEVDSIQFEGRLIGFTFDICCRGRSVRCVMGHEPDFNLFGPGRLVDREKILKAQRLNYRLYDFGSGYEPYKLEWATHLDYTRKFVMCTMGKRERVLRLIEVAFATCIAMIKSNRRFVELKRDRLGELRYFFTRASLKERKEMLMSKFRQKLHGRILDVYSLEKKVYENESSLRELSIQEVSECKSQSELITHYYRGYKLYTNDGENVISLSHDRFMREESLDFIQELPSDTIYVKDYDWRLLSNVLNIVQKDASTIWTSANWFEWRKRRAFAKLGFRPIERIYLWRFFNWSKVYRKNIAEK